MTKQVPVLEGWFTEGEKPHLLGTQCKSCHTYYFPKQHIFCKNPCCDSDEFDEVELSRTGKLWSFTNAMYQPPEPFVAEDPHVPYTILAVELEKEKMTILGQGIKGLECSELKAGMEMELVLETLFKDDESEKLTWKWKPVSQKEGASS